MKEHPVHKGYFLTEQGDIYSYWKLGKFPSIDYNKPPRLLSPKVDTNGYVSIIIGGRNGKRYRVHRLMMETFYPNDHANILQVNHKDHNRSNNKLSNLEWSTCSQNLRHSNTRPKSKR